jgi:hypothetical protein
MDPQAEYVASLIPGSETVLLPGDLVDEAYERAAAEAIREFIGADRQRTELDTLLSTRAGSTPVSASGSTASSPA